MQTLRWCHSCRGIDFLWVWHFNSFSRQFVCPRRFRS